MKLNRKIPKKWPFLLLGVSGLSIFSSLLFAQFSSADSIFQEPTVLHIGGLLKPAYEPTLTFDCHSGSTRLQPCPAGGEQISQVFFKTVFQDLDACVRETMHELGNDDSGVITFGTEGITSARDVAGENTLSLHAAARAIDITSVTLGNLSFNFTNDFRNRADGTHLEKFWHPLSACMMAKFDFYTNLGTRYWIITAETEIDIIKSSARDTLSNELFKLNPSLFHSSSDGSRGYPATPAVFQKLTEISAQVIDGFEKTLQASRASLDPTLQSALIAGVSELGVTITSVQARSFIQKMSQGTLHHLDHMHLSEPFTTEDMKEPFPAGAAPLRGIDSPTRGDLLSNYAQG